MKILVPIKRVIDPNIKIQFTPDRTAVDLTNLKMAINPFCEIAVEEAIRIRESGKATEVIAVSIGNLKVQEQLRAALAMGADKAIHILSDVELEPLAVAKCLAAIYKRENPALVIFGRQSVDGDNNQTGQLLAGLCNLPQATYASNILLQDGEVQVTREVDDGQETLALRLPAVITADLRLNSPRFTTLPNIMKAKQKPLEVIAVSDLNVVTGARTKLLNEAPPPERKNGIKVASVTDLIEKLRYEAKVI